jgi:DHA2 family methylenomycin A resistance protein-like MFS transporter
MTVVTGAMAFLSGRLVARIREWPAIVVGLSAGAGGALLISLAPTRGVTPLIVSSLPVGVTALAMPAMTAVAMGHAPPERLGLASGVFNAARQTGGALGVAVLGALLASGSGYIALRAAFVATAGAYAGGIVLALTGWRRTRQHRPRPRDSAEPAAGSTDADVLMTHNGQTARDLTRRPGR